MQKSQVFIVKEVLRTETENGDRSYISVICWTYDWDGNRRRFNRVAVELEIDHYKGKRLITSLPCYPLSRYPGDTEALKAKLINRGKRFRELCLRPRGKQMFEYDGPAYFRGTGVRHPQGNPPPNMVSLSIGQCRFPQLPLTSRLYRLMPLSSTDSQVRGAFGARACPRSLGKGVATRM